MILIIMTNKCFGRTSMDILNPICTDDILSCFPIRKPDTHKGDYGKILLICGSKNYTGAAALSALGALRSGAGVVYLAVPESIYAIEAIKLLEPVVMSFPDKDGMFSETAVSQILSLIPKMDAVLIGPGIGVSDGTLTVVKSVLQNADCPVVVDADGINLISKHKHILRDRIAPTILTPHDGEFRRLGGMISANRVECASLLAQDLGCIVLLKGHRTVITDGLRCYVNHTGNAGMATGGSGDVLAGIIVSLLGQGLDPLKAAACGAWLHGRAGDLCAEEIGQYGMLPQDMVNVLPRLLR